MELRKFIEENWKDQDNTFITWAIDGSGWSDSCFIYKEGNEYIVGSIENDCVNNIYDNLEDLLNEEEMFAEDAYDFEVVDKGEDILPDLKSWIFEYKDLDEPYEDDEYEEEDDDEVDYF